MGNITRTFANNIGTSGVMKATAFNNNSFDNVTSVASGAITSGEVEFISTTSITSAQASATVSLTGTFDEYIFYFEQMHPGSASVGLQMQTSTDGTNFNLNTTTAYFLSRNSEDGSSNELSYKTSLDAHNSTSFYYLSVDQINSGDSICCGTLSIFNAKNTTFMKNFKSRIQQEQNNNSMENYVGGYIHTTSAITHAKFQYSSGNIDNGKIHLFGR